MTADGNRGKRTELQRLLSKRGIASRAAAGPIVRAGRVAVNGIVVRDPHAFVSINCRLTVDGAEKPREEHERIVIAFHKPRGVVTTTADERGRQTVFDLLPAEYRHLRAVGRLDLATSGLLLFTNDAVFADALLDPERHCPKRYVVTVRGAVPDELEGRFLAGVEDEGELLHAAAVTLRKRSNRESQLLITLTEGKNRQIRRMCAACGHEVLKLKRISFGPVELGELPPGEVRVVPEDIFGPATGAGS